MLSSRRGLARSRPDFQPDCTSWSSWSAEELPSRGNRSTNRGTDTSKGSQFAARAMRSRRAYTRCERMSTTQICTRISSGLLLLKSRHSQILFEQAKSQFNIPATRIQLGHLPQGKYLRITHIGQIHAHSDPITQPHQPYQVARLLLAGP